MVYIKTDQRAEVVVVGCQRGKYVDSEAENRDTPRGLFCSLAEEGTGLQGEEGDQLSIIT